MNNAYGSDLFFLFSHYYKHVNMKSSTHCTFLEYNLYRVRWKTKDWGEIVFVQERYPRSFQQLVI